MIILTITLILFIISLCSVYWYQTRSEYARLINKFPLVDNYIPVLGHVLALSRKRDVMFKDARRYLKSFNETFAGWAGTFGSIHITTVEDAEILLTNTKYIDKGVFYGFFHQWLGSGLLTSTGTKWHQRRKMLTPAFHYNILQMFVEIFGEKSVRLTERLKGECNKTKTDIVPFITQTTLETICETSMGLKLEDDKTQKQYYKAIHNVAEYVVIRVMSPWLHPDFTFFFSPMYWKQMKLTKLLHKFTTDIINKRRKTFDEKDVTDLEVNDGKTKKRLAMLDLLIYANKHLGTIDDEGIREEVDTFVFEGHDTTSIGICMALTLIANHPDAQKKIVNELDEIFGDSDRHATYDDLQNMKYLECCLKESLRLYPSVPFITRNNPVDIPLTNHIAPAHAEIFLHTYNVHRDPKHWSDPEKFDPDRFLPENIKGRHPYAYIPFSAGPRNCIGQKFAMLELKSIISAILRNFTLEPIDAPENLNFVIDLVLRVQGPIYVKFKSRSQVNGNIPSHQRSNGLEIQKSEA